MRYLKALVPKVDEAVYIRNFVFCLFAELLRKRRNYHHHHDRSDSACMLLRRVTLLKERFAALTDVVRTILGIKAQRRVDHLLSVGRGFIS